MKTVPRYHITPILEVVVLAMLLITPLLASRFITISLTPILILAMLAISFDLCWGYTGILSFGQGFFFGIGGYTVALLINKAQFLNFYALSAAAILSGIIIAGLFGVFLFFGSTRQGIFIALSTLALSYLGERLFNGWFWVGAANGQNIWEVVSVMGIELNPGISFYYFILFLLAVTYLLCRFVVKSQLGLVLSGVRQNEERLDFLGYRIQVPKFLIFVFAAAIAGFAGGLYSLHEAFVGPTYIGWVFSTFAALYCIFGGSGTLIGPIIGTLAIELGRLYLTDIEEIRAYWQIVLGLLMIGVIVFRPTGIVGFIISEKERIGYFGYKVSKWRFRKKWAQKASMEGPKI